MARGDRPQPTSTLFACQAVAPGMIERRSGDDREHVLAGRPERRRAGRAAPTRRPRAAVIALTKALAKELAPHGVRVNCVSPGLIDDTKFHARFTTREVFDGDHRRASRWAAPPDPDEVATVIAFLAGDDSSFLTGETIEINGGLLMR